PMVNRNNGSKNNWTLNIAAACLLNPEDGGIASCWMAMTAAKTKMNNSPTSCNQRLLSICRHSSLMKPLFNGGSPNQIHKDHRAPITRLAVRRQAIAAPHPCFQKPIRDNSSGSIPPEHTHTPRVRY